MKNKIAMSIDLLKNKLVLKVWDENCDLIGYEDLKTVRQMIAEFDELVEKGDIEFKPLDVKGKCKAKDFRRSK